LVYRRRRSEAVVNTGTSLAFTEVGASWGRRSARRSHPASVQSSASVPAHWSAPPVRGRQRLPRQLDLQHLLRGEADVAGAIFVPAFVWLGAAFLVWRTIRMWRDPEYHKEGSRPDGASFSSRSPSVWLIGLRMAAKRPSAKLEMPRWMLPKVCEPSSAMTRSRGFPG
jgi:hypothetical protein